MASDPASSPPVEEALRSAVARFARLADILEFQVLGFERADRPVGPEGSRALAPETCRQAVVDLQRLLSALPVDLLNWSDVAKRQPVGGSTRPVPPPRAPHHPSASYDAAPRKRAPRAGAEPHPPAGRRLTVAVDRIDQGQQRPWSTRPATPVAPTSSAGTSISCAALTMSSGRTGR